MSKEDEDHWLLETREEINFKIQRGIDELDRGEGIPEDQLEAYLTKLKAKLENSSKTTKIMLCAAQFGADRGGFKLNGATGVAGHLYSQWLISLKLKPTLIS